MGPPGQRESLSLLPSAHFFLLSLPLPFQSFLFSPSRCGSADERELWLWKASGESGPRAPNIQRSLGVPVGGREASGRIAWGGVRLVEPTPGHPESI